MKREKEKREPAGESQSQNDSDGVSESENKRQEKTLKVVCFIKAIKHGEDTLTNKGLVPWRLRRLARSKVRSASLVKVLSDGKISWIPWSQDL